MVMSSIEMTSHFPFIIKCFVTHRAHMLGLTIMFLHMSLEGGEELIRVSTYGALKA